MTTHTPAPQWRPITGFPGWWISEQGVAMTPKGQLRTGSPDVGGNRTILISRFGRKRSTTIHRLLLEEFVGPPPSPEHQAARWDQDPGNNEIANLVWLTAREVATLRRIRNLESV